MEFGICDSSDEAEQGEYPVAYENFVQAMMWKFSGSIETNLKYKYIKFIFCSKIARKWKMTGSNRNKKKQLERLQFIQFKPNSMTRKCIRAITHMCMLSCECVCMQCVAQQHIRKSISQPGDLNNCRFFFLRPIIISTR